MAFLYSSDSFSLIGSLPLSLPVTPPPPEAQESNKIAELITIYDNIDLTRVFMGMSSMLVFSDYIIGCGLLLNRGFSFAFELIEKRTR
jgi:hypothetical protein